jgi:CheY-like chemotaxis protein
VRAPSFGAAARWPEVELRRSPAAAFGRPRRRSSSTSGPRGPHKRGVRERGRAGRLALVKRRPPSDRVRVLVVDDDADFARAMMTALTEDARIDVVGIATDGEQALAVSKSLLPDVMLLDLDMPRVDGYEVMRRINRRTRQPAIIVLTGISDLEDLDRAARLKPDALLQKTTDADLIVTGVVLALALGKRPVPA